MNRREFVGLAAGAGTMAGPVLAAAIRQPARPGDDHRGACVISSRNGLPAVERAMQLLREGIDPLDAAVAGVNIVEDDPGDNSVGYGGLPNEEGIVELDASVMHGPLHRAGAVASLRNIKNPSLVALVVLRRTDHVLLVGEGALRFARAHGFKEQDLLTEESRKAWLKWKENLSPEDDWLNDDQRDDPKGHAGLDSRPAPQTTGTINCLAVTAAGDLGGVTSTSGLSYKIPGRVGDSPIIGAGLYVDNAIGAAGATGRGEATLQNCAAYSIVREMDSGKLPTDACLAVARQIADHTRERRLQDPQGRPNFNVTLYALRKDGAYGSACILPGATFTANDGTGSRRLDSTPLFPRR
jgi:N4-(beta-N-acetylglucosaminyl)-L-asparaginase